MKRMLWTKAIVPLAAVAAATIASPALAGNPDCATLPGATYLTGSSAAKPFIAVIAKALAGTTTLVYQGQGSCNGPDAIINGTKITGTASFWDNAGTETTCNLTVTGDTADVGLSDVFATTCPGFASLPSGVGDFFGPNQVMNFVVPSASSQTLLSAEAAYFVYGFGAAGMVTPWNNETFILQRNATSGTEQMIATAIHVPASKWKGALNQKSGDLLAALTASTSPEATIGILSSDVADVNRSKLKILAYQHFKQDCAWLPDSSSTSFDKINVRDGHYPIWGPLHMLAKIGADQLPTKPEAAKFVGYFTGTVQPPAGVNILDLEIASHTVPDCAMRVKRSTEIGDVSPYTPAKSCGCYFESKANGAAPASCSTCTGDADCTKAGATHCNYGYCEAN